MKGGGGGPGEDEGGLGGRAVEEEETVEEVDGPPGPCGEEGGVCGPLVPSILMLWAKTPLESTQTPAHYPGRTNIPRCCETGGRGVAQIWPHRCRQWSLRREVGI